MTETLRTLDLSSHIWCEYCHTEEATVRCSGCKKAYCCTTIHYTLYWDFVHRYLCPATKFRELEKAPLPDQITELVTKNEAYRRVFYTVLVNLLLPGTAAQLVAMSIKDTVGWEKHPKTTQYFLVKRGRGRAYIGSDSDRAKATMQEVKENSAWYIFPGTWHDVENLDKVSELKLFTTYFPPHHKPGTLHLTKKDAEGEVLL